MTDTLVGARRADEADHSTIVVLAELARREARPERGGRLLLDHDFAAEPVRDRLAAAGQHDQATVVGTIDGIVVGYGIIRRSEAGPVVVGQIDELFVHADGRGIGVAAAMLAELRLWAIDQGCQSIESQVLPGNRPAKNFFERVGMVTRMMRVSVPLTD